MRVIMVVEDESPLRDIFCEAMEFFNYETVDFDNAEDALDYFRKSPVQVVFTDLALGKIDGIELCQEIKDIKPTTYVIAVTGFANYYTVEDCLRAGFNDIMIKPIIMEDLKRRLEIASEMQERWENMG